MNPHNRALSQFNEVLVRFFLLNHHRFARMSNFFVSLANCAFGPGILLGKKGNPVLLSERIIRNCTRNCRPYGSDDASSEEGRGVHSHCLN